MKNLRTYRKIKNKKKVILSLAAVVVFASYVDSKAKELEDIYMKEDTYAEVRKAQEEILAYSTLYNTVSNLMDKLEDEQMKNTTSTTFLYTVRPLDTLSSIAENFEDTVEGICKRNQISKDDILRDGVTLKIHGSLEKSRMHQWELYKSQQLPEDAFIEKDESTLSSKSL